MSPVSSSVITISASYGAGGSVVGPQVAERLGVRFVDRAIPVAVSARLAVPLDDALAHEERPHQTLRQLMPLFNSAIQMFAGAPVPPEMLEHDGREFLATTEQVLHEYAASGAVILGRAAAVVLGDVPNALHVRLDGPAERRVTQAIGLQDVDLTTAKEQLRTADLSREAYVRHWYHVDPRDPSLYHLVLDSTTIDLDTCVELIALASISRVSPDRR